MSEATRTTESLASGPGKPLDYDAFLSYTHRDRPVVAGIQKGLHRIGRRVGQLRALRVFRDDTDLTASPEHHRRAGPLTFFHRDAVPAGPSTGQQIGDPITGHTDVVTSVAFSPDGRRLISGSQDATVRLWDAGTGAPIGQPLTTHTEQVMGVAFSPDGQRIVSASSDHTLRLWPAPDRTAWPRLLCAKLTANMSHKQWNDWVSPDVDYIQLCPGLPIAPDSAVL